MHTELYLEKGFLIWFLRGFWVFLILKWPHQHFLWPGKRSRKPSVREQQGEFPTWSCLMREEPNFTESRHGTNQLLCIAKTTRPLPGAFGCFFRFTSFFARKVRAEPALLCSKPLPWDSDVVSQWNLPSSPLLPSHPCSNCGSFGLGYPNLISIPLQMYQHHHHQKKKECMSRLWSFVI